MITVKTIKEAFDKAKKEIKKPPYHFMHERFICEDCGEEHYLQYRMIKGRKAICIKCFQNYILSIADKKNEQ